MLTCLLLTSATAQARQLSPSALVATSDGNTIYVACADGGRILRFDTRNGRVSGTLAMPEKPMGLALAESNNLLVAVCAVPESAVCLVDLKKFKLATTIPAGHSAMAPVISPDGQLLYVCNRFNNDISVIDLARQEPLCRIAVQREPVAAAITKDGKHLLVANYLPAGPANMNYVSACVSVIDTALRQVVKELHLPNGSGSLNDLKISPDGKYAVVPHIVGRFNRLATHVTEGWINANALSIIDVEKLQIYGTTLLDDWHRGAANPWAAAWSGDGKKLIVTHAGAHEVSIIDFAQLLAKLPPLPDTYDAIQAAEAAAVSKAKYALPDDLSFFPGQRLRIPLGPEDLAPRSAAVAGDSVYVANYFSDTIDAIDLAASLPKAKSYSLGPKPQMAAARKGELYFHDARICYEGWQSCASCHPGDARVDGLNWDLLNDGVNNAKNTRSLLMSAKTAPLMSLGVRADLDTAVRAGIQHILFTSLPSNEVADSIAAYLKSLKPVPSPLLVHGQLSTAAQRGKNIFQQAGCASCHVPGFYTDLRSHDVGTRQKGDQPDDKFYTPTLIETWRTAPYLHDGSAASIQDVLTTKNSQDQHGRTSQLSPEQLADLVAYVLSL